MLLIGGLAGAVAAVIALLPKPVETREAHFDNVMAEPHVSLREYEARTESEGASSGGGPSASTGVVPYRLAADVTSKLVVAGTEEAGETSTESTSASKETSGESTVKAGGESTTETTGEPTTEATGESTGTTPAGAGTSASTTSSTQALSSLPPSPEPEPSAVESAGGEESAEGTGRSPAARHAVVAGLEEHRMAPSPACPHPCETRWLARAHRTARGLNPLIDHELAVFTDPARAARALAANFATCRPKVDGHLQSPLGVTISYSLQLDGFANQWLTVWWSLESLSGGEALPSCWWKEVSVEEVRPNVNHRTLTERFWVPMPRQRGDYRVHLVLTDSEGRKYESGYTTSPIH